MMTSVFVGTSADGFLARPNHALDFLDAGGSEPHGYEEFIATVDVIVIGRKTFDVVLAFPEWPYGKNQVVVLSSRPLDFSKIPNAVVEQMSGAPSEIVEKPFCPWLPARLHRRRKYDSRFPSRRRDPAAHRNPRAHPDRRRHSAIWFAPARRQSPPHRHPHLQRRPGAIGVRGRDQVV